MKQTIGITGIFLMIFLLCSSGFWDKKNRIYGNWELVNGKNDGIAAPKMLSNRIQTFDKNNTFESNVKTPNGLIRSNGGFFYLINDTTMVTYHSNNGITGTLANSYNFSIKNDSLHFYGYYLSQLPQNKLLRVYVDEIWVKSKIR